MCFVEMPLGESVLQQLQKDEMKIVSALPSGKERESAY